MSERWLFRIDLKRYGPVEVHDLEELLRPPRIAQRIDVRPESGDDDWFTVSPQDDLSTAARYFDVELRQQCHSPASGSQYQQFARSSGFLAEAVGGLFASASEFVSEHRWVVLAGVMWVVANTLVYHFAFNSRSEERGYLQTYTEIWDEFQQLKTDDVTAARWQEFASESKARLESIVDDLSGTAGVDQPVRRNLLWAGRDCLVPLVSASEPPEDSARIERAYEEHIQAVISALNGSE